MPRPRKSPDEKRIDGNPGKKRILADAFVPEGAPFVPAHLHDDAQACAELIIQCFPTKRLTKADSFVLSGFATAWAWHKHATHIMADPLFQPIVKGSTGQDVVNPWFKILNDSAAVMLKYASKLYLTPADRAGLSSAADNNKSKFDGLVGRTMSSASLSS